MKAILERIARNRAGGNRGIYSVCSAHPIAIEAALIHALRNGESMACIEATSNQVNQDGGYTGMQPAGFRDFVHGIADGVGFARSRVVLGGDHLGPNPWQAQARRGRDERSGNDGLGLCHRGFSQDSPRLLDDLRRRQADRCGTKPSRGAARSSAPPPSAPGRARAASRPCT